MAESAYDHGLARAARRRPRRWRALLSLALLLGLIGGVVLTAAAGARRTDTAYPRLLTWANATQVDIAPEGTGLTGYYAALARLPHIAAMTTGSPTRWCCRGEPG